MARKGPFIHKVHIADGFADDCDELIHRCSKIKTLTYNVFTEIWKDMNFASMYKCRTSGAEIAEVSEEVIRIAKHYMTANTSNYEENVAGLFLVYALYSLQPYSGFAPVRFVPEDVVAIKRIETVARRERRNDVLFVLGKLLVTAGHFHAADRERGMEGSYRKYLEGYTSIDRLGVRPKGVFLRQNEEIDLLREIQGLLLRYYAAKAIVSKDNGRIDRNLDYINHDLGLEMSASLKDVINGMVDEDSDDDDDKELLKAMKTAKLDPSAQRQSTVQEIKQRAMMNPVDPIKHLTGLQERADTLGSKDDEVEAQSQPGSAKKPSPRKVITSLARKTKLRKKGTRRKRSSYVSSSSDSNSTDDRASGVSSEDEINLADFQKELSKDPNENEEFEVELDSLPVFLKSQGDDDSQIEIIDKYQGNKSTDEAMFELSELDLQQRVSALPEVTIERTSDIKGKKKLSPEPSTSNEMARLSKLIKRPKTDAPKLKRTEKREQKKTLLQSKFKRMGMLPVANFKEGK